jgi:hypothetical protein
MDMRYVQQAPGPFGEAKNFWAGIESGLGLLVCYEFLMAGTRAAAENAPLMRRTNKSRRGFESHLVSIRFASITPSGIDAGIFDN